MPFTKKYTDKKALEIASQSNTFTSPDGSKWGLVIDDSGTVSAQKFGELIWSDDFTQATLDTTKWDYETGYVRNSEPQNYSNSLDNVFIRDNQLVLKAIKDVNGEWTSGSVITNNKFEFGNGRIEANIKLPLGAGMWGAFWLLGAGFEVDYGTGEEVGVSYVESREIDILEHYNSGETVFTNVWYKSNPQDSYLGSTGTLQSPYLDMSVFHLYAMERNDQELKFYVDDVLYYMHPLQMKD